MVVGTAAGGDGGGGGGERCSDFASGPSQWGSAVCVDHSEWASVCVASEWGSVCVDRSEWWVR